MEILLDINGQPTSRRCSGRCKRLRQGSTATTCWVSVNANTGHSARMKRLQKPETSNTTYEMPTMEHSWNMGRLAFWLGAINPHF